MWFLSSIFDWSLVSKSFLVSVYESCSWFPTINPKNDPRLNHFSRGRPQAINRTVLPFLWKVLFINNIEHTHTHLYQVSSPLTVRLQSGAKGCVLGLPDPKYNGRIVNLERKESEAERDHFLMFSKEHVGTVTVLYVH